MLYRRDPSSLLRYKIHSTKIDKTEKDLLNHDKALDEVKMHLLKAQCRMKQNVDLGRKEVQFMVVKKGFLKFPP